MKKFIFTFLITLLLYVTPIYADDLITVSIDSVSSTDNIL